MMKQHLALLYVLFIFGHQVNCQTTTPAPLTGNGNGIPTPPPNAGSSNFPLLSLSDVLNGSFPQFVFYNVRMNYSISWGPLPGGGGGGVFNFIGLNSAPSTASAWTQLQPVKCSGVNPCPVATSLNVPLTSQQVAVQLVPNLGCLQWFNVWGGNVQPLIRILSDCNQAYQITQNEVFYFLPLPGNPNVFTIQSYLNDTTYPPYGPMCVSALINGLYLDYCSNVDFSNILWSLYGVVTTPSNAGGSQYPLLALSDAVGGNYPQFVLYNLGMNAAISWNEVAATGTPGNFNFIPLNSAPSNPNSLTLLPAVTCGASSCTPATTLKSPLGNQQVTVKLATFSSSCPNSGIFFNVWGGSAVSGANVYSICHPLVNTGNEAFYFQALGGTSNIFLIQANQTSKGVFCVATNGAAVSQTSFTLLPCSIPDSKQQWALYGVPCPSGYGVIGGVCRACPAGTYSSSNNLCTQCPVGTYSSTSGSTSCTVCPSGATSGGGASSCTSCPIGSNSTTGICVLCPAGTFGSVNDNGYAACYPCFAGQITSQPGQTHGVSCPVNYYPDSSATSCIACPAGTSTGGLSGVPSGDFCCTGGSLSRCAVSLANSVASVAALGTTLACVGDAGWPTSEFCSLSSFFGVMKNAYSAISSVLSLKDTCQYCGA